MYACTFTFCPDLAPTVCAFIAERQSADAKATQREFERVFHAGTQTAKQIDDVLEAERRAAAKAERVMAAQELATAKAEHARAKANIDRLAREEKEAAVVAARAEATEAARAASQSRESSLNDANARLILEVDRLAREKAESAAARDAAASERTASQNRESSLMQELAAVRAATAKAETDRDQLAREKQAAESAQQAALEAAKRDALEAAKADPAVLQAVRARCNAERAAQTTVERAEATVRWRCRILTRFFTSALRRKTLASFANWRRAATSIKDVEHRHNQRRLILMHLSAAVSKRGFAEAFARWRRWELDNLRAVRYREIREVEGERRRIALVRLRALWAKRKITNPFSRWRRATDAMPLESEMAVLRAQMLSARPPEAACVHKPTGKNFEVWLATALEDARRAHATMDPDVAARLSFASCGKVAHCGDVHAVFDDVPVAVIDAKEGSTQFDQIEKVEDDARSVSQQHGLRHVRGVKITKNKPISLGARTGTVRPGTWTRLSKGVLCVAGPSGGDGADDPLFWQHAITYVYYFCVEAAIEHARTTRSHGVDPNALGQDIIARAEDVASMLRGLRNMMTDYAPALLQRFEDAIATHVRPTEVGKHRPQSRRHRDKITSHMVSDTPPGAVGGRAAKAAQQADGAVAGALVVHDDTEASDASKKRKRAVESDAHHDDTGAGRTSTGT